MSQLQNQREDLYYVPLLKYFPTNVIPILGNIFNTSKLTGITLKHKLELFILSLACRKLQLSLICDGGNLLL